MQPISGIDLLAETEGTGKVAAKGHKVIFNTRIFLNRGDEVPLNDKQVAVLPETRLRRLEGYTFVDRHIVLGKREAIAGVEKPCLV